MSDEPGLVAGPEVFLGKGHYRIVRPMDEGSAGRYVAEDLDSGGLVTLVFLRCSSLGRAGTARFLHRAARLAALSAAHPGVPRVRGSGRDDDRVFMVVEQPKGRRVDDVRARDQRLEIETALGIAIQVAEVLEAARNLGVTHGTLTSHVVTVDEIGAGVTVSGFEIAIVRDCQTPSPPDSPLEGVAGVRAAERADVQALGGVLYQLVTGTAPARSGSVPVRRLRRDVPPDVDRLIAETLGHTPGDVPDLSRVLNDLYAAVRRPAAPQRERRLTGAVLIVGLAALLAIAGVLALRLLPAPPGGPPPVASPSAASPVAQPAAPPPAAAPATLPAVSHPAMSPKVDRAAAKSGPVPLPAGSADGGITREGERRPPGDASATTPTVGSPAARTTRTSPAVPTSRDAEGAAARASDTDAEDPGALIDWLLRSRAGGG